MNFIFPTTPGRRSSFRRTRLELSVGECSGLCLYDNILMHHVDLSGPYWQQPGRSIVESLLVHFPLPSASSRPHFTSLHRAFFSDKLPEISESTHPPCTTSLDPVLLTHDWTMSELAAYLGTFSAAHTYDEGFAGESDVARDFSQRLKEALRVEGVEEGDRFRVAWRMGTVQGKLEG